MMGSSCIVVLLILFSVSSCVAQPSIKVSVDIDQIGIGQSVMVDVQVIGAAAGTIVWPFLNQSQWGANPPIDSNGTTSFVIPVPIAGTAILQVVISQQPPAGPFFVGLPLSDFGGVTSSNEVEISVSDRVIQRPNPNKGYYVAMEWEPWFTENNFYWQVSESIPVVGRYDSFNTMVMLQHTIWLSEAGIDTLVVDWTNNLWNTPSWSARGSNIQQLINATTKTLEFYTYLRKNTQIPTPMVILLLGLDNGAVTPEPALNEEIEFIWNSYVNNASIDADLWLIYEDKPFHVVFDGGNMHPGIAPLNNTHFTLRWMASQLQSNSLNKQGYWSWMDGSLAPIPTYYNNSVEALTVTPSFFAGGGWLAPDAYPRRGGTVFVEQFKTAAQYPPKFLIINQWNEFAGTPNGASSYADEYSLIFSDDIEPTNFQICSYPRPNQKCGGYGFFYLNLLTALLQLHEQGSNLNFTILTVGNPEPYDIVNQTSIEVMWNTIGPDPKIISVLMDGKMVTTSGPSPSSVIIDMSHYPNGEHVLTVLGVGAQTPYALSLNKVDVVTGEMIVPRIDVPFSINL